MQAYANQIGYTDVTPWEVIRVVSEKTLEIRRMKAERDPSFKPEFIVGGFAGHCVNQYAQKWIITSDETETVQRIRLGKKGWKGAYGRFVLEDAPRSFYDYNF